MMAIIATIPFFVYLVLVVTMLVMVALLRYKIARAEVAKCPAWKWGILYILCEFLGGIFTVGTMDSIFVGDISLFIKASITFGFLYLFLAVLISNEAESKGIKSMIKGGVEK